MSIKYHLWCRCKNYEDSTFRLQILQYSELLIIIWPWTQNRLTCKYIIPWITMWQIWGRGGGCRHWWSQKIVGKTDKGDWVTYIGWQRKFCLKADGDWLTHFLSVKAVARDTYASKNSTKFTKESSRKRITKLGFFLAHPPVIYALINNVLVVNVKKYFALSQILHSI